jgi:photosystem I subunit 2
METNCAKTIIPLTEINPTTGGFLEYAQTDEFYSIVWTSTLKDQFFELPIGGTAIMNNGKNLVCFAKKEQCLALGFGLRDLFGIKDYQVFRHFFGGEIEYLHPKDGVFPEKVNLGRVSFGYNSGTVGNNTEPAKLKFSNFSTWTRGNTVLSEAEWLSTMSRV